MGGAASRPTEAEQRPRDGAVDAAPPAPVAENGANAGTPTAPAPRKPSRAELKAQKKQAQQTEKERQQQEKRHAKEEKKAGKKRRDAQTAQTGDDGGAAAAGAATPPTAAPCVLLLLLRVRRVRMGVSDAGRMWSACGRSGGAETPASSQPGSGPRTGAVGGGRGTAGAARRSVTRARAQDAPTDGRTVRPVSSQQLTSADSSDGGAKSPGEAHAPSKRKTNTDGRPPILPKMPRQPVDVKSAGTGQAVRASRPRGEGSHLSDALIRAARCSTRDRKRRAIRA